VFAANDRAEAKRFAREQIRHGGAVVSIELRERGNDSVVIWRLLRSLGGVTIFVRRTHRCGRMFNPAVCWRVVT
jgi:hypothetical protein